MRSARRGGFTLVELLISMLILAIGIMAVLSMQFTALGGAMLSRDNSNASDVARRMMQVMRSESQQWRQNDLMGSISQSAYDDSAFKASPVLASVVDGGESWVSLFDQPLDARLSTRGAARYCAYSRGYSPGPDSGVYQIQVAVVFPSANESFEGNKCRGYGTDELDPELAPEDSLQMQGLRVQYFGTQIARRGHLPPVGG
ncbi:MAG: prepilin-type N-terminal cleavage/methylation domain-containing protein [Persicimonas sp.]